MIFELGCIFLIIVGFYCGYSVVVSKETNTVEKIRAVLAVILITASYAKWKLEITDEQFYYIYSFLILCALTVR